MASNGNVRPVRMDWSEVISVFTNVIDGHDAISSEGGTWSNILIFVSPRSNNNRIMYLKRSPTKHLSI